MSLWFKTVGAVFKLDKDSCTWSKVGNGSITFQYNKIADSLKLIIQSRSSSKKYILKHKIQVNENYSIILSGSTDMKHSQHTLAINFRTPNDAELCINWLKQTVNGVTYTSKNKNISAPSQSLLFQTTKTNKKTKKGTKTKTKKKTKTKLYSHNTHKTKLLKSQKRISRYRAKFHDREAAEFDIKERIIIFLVYVLVIIIPIFWFFGFKTVKQYEMGVVLRLGKIRGNALKCGLHIVLPFIDDLRIIDMRVQTIKLKKTNILCSDGITIQVQAIIFTKVVNPWPVGMGGGNCNSWFRNLAYPILRDVIGKYVLMDLLQAREEINNSLKFLFQKETYKYGVNVWSFEIKNILVAKGMQRTMASHAEAERNKQATIIAATADVECAENLKNAAKQMNEANGALLLRYLHTINKIGKEARTTIYFPYLMHFKMFQDCQKR